MSKEYEKLRREIQKVYKSKMTVLEATNKELQKENGTMKIAIIEYEEKLACAVEWVERMQEYVNLSDKELQTLFSHAKTIERMYEVIDNTIARYKF